MIKNAIHAIFSTDAIPIAGGATGAIMNTIIFPPASTLISTAILAGLGAFVGYFVKLCLDKMFAKLKEKKNTVELR
jgi:hypothetical protein